MRLVLGFLVNIILYTSSFAQVEGTVKNSTGAAVPFATVTIIDHAKGTVLLFSSTNKEGDYSIKLGNISVANETLALQVNSLGYQKESRQLREGSVTYHFILKEEVKSLSPVIIKGERAKLRLSGDTLSYNAAAFTNPSDRVIEDVIKRLPGVEVTEGGRISYNGKNITNFYIEGDNLLDDKYAIGTKNIPNRIVDKIQVFENHQPIKLLSDLTVTDQVDMNITFKDDAKIRPIQQVEIGGGLPGNFDGALTSLFFLKKYKAINYVKAKYGDLTPQDPLEIRISLVDNYFTFSCKNKIASGALEIESLRIGVRNTQQRLAAFFGKRHQLLISEDSGFYSVLLTIET